MNGNISVRNPDQQIISKDDLTVDIASIFLRHFYPNQHAIMLCDDVRYLVDLEILVIIYHSTFSLFLFLSFDLDFKFYNI